MAVSAYKEMLVFLQTQHKEWEAAGKVSRQTYLEYADTLQDLRANFPTFVTDLQQLTNKAYAITNSNQSQFTQRIQEIYDFTDKLLKGLTNETEVKAAAAQPVNPMASADKAFQDCCRLMRAQNDVGSQTILKICLQRLAGQSVPPCGAVMELGEFQNHMTIAEQLNRKSSPHERMAIKGQFEACLKIIDALQKDVRCQRAFPILKQLQIQIQTYVQNFNPEDTEATKCSKLLDACVNLSFYVHGALNDQFCYIPPTKMLPLIWNDFGNVTQQRIITSANWYLGTDITKIKDWDSCLNSLISHLLKEDAALYAAQCEDLALLTLYVLEKQCKNLNEFKNKCFYLVNAVIKSDTKSVNYQTKRVEALANASAYLFKTCPARLQLSLEVLQARVLECMVRPELLSCCVGLEKQRQHLLKIGRYNTLQLFIYLAIYLPEKNLLELPSMLPQWLEQLDKDITASTTSVKEADVKMQAATAAAVSASGLMFPTSNEAEIKYHAAVAVSVAYPHPARQEEILTLTQIRSKLQTWKQTAEIGFCDPECNMEIRSTSEKLDALVQNDFLEKQCFKDIMIAKESTLVLVNITDPILYIKKIKEADAAIQAILNMLHKNDTPPPAKEADVKMQAATAAAVAPPVLSVRSPAILDPQTTLISIQSKLTQWKEMPEQIGFCDPEHHASIRKATQDLISLTQVPSLNVYEQFLRSAAAHISVLEAITDAQQYIQKANAAAVAIQSMLSTLNNTSPQPVRVSDTNIEQMLKSSDIEAAEKYARSLPANSASQKAAYSSLTLHFVVGKQVDKAVEYAQLLPPADMLDLGSKIVATNASCWLEVVQKFQAIHLEKSAMKTEIQRDLEFLLKHTDDEGLETFREILINIS